MDDATLVLLERLFHGRGDRGVAVYVAPGGAARVELNRVVQSFGAPFSKAFAAEGSSAPEAVAMALAAWRARFGADDLES